MSTDRARRDRVRTRHRLLGAVSGVALPWTLPTAGRFVAEVEDDGPRGAGGGAARRDRGAAATGVERGAVGQRRDPRLVERITEAVLARGGRRAGAEIRFPGPAWDRGQRLGLLPVVAIAPRRALRRTTSGITAADGALIAALLGAGQSAGYPWAPRGGLPMPRPEFIRDCVRAAIRDEQPPRRTGLLDAV